LTLVGIGRVERWYRPGLLLIATPRTSCRRSRGSAPAPVAADDEADRATRAALVALRQLHSLDDYQALRTAAAIAGRHSAMKCSPNPGKLRPLSERDSRDFR